jgi:osmoprotectant transport system permease protein
VNGFFGLMADTWRLAVEDRADLASSAAAHLDLVVEALAIACLIAIPVGILASRSKPVERAAVGLANVLQTVPSLALLGFLLVLFHGAIGKPPALAALVIYALLPILKNTILGLRSVDRGVIEAAEGMGMTPVQRLRMVELPLAVPVILGGVRVAAVAAVGMATIAAFIGAKGLGGFIQRGLSTRDARQILLGAIPAGLLALACDAALGELERTLDPKRSRASFIRRSVAVLAVVALLLAAAWGGFDEWREQHAKSGGKTVTVGSKDGGEMILLGHMMADLIEAHTDLKVDRRMNLSGSLICFDALKSGGLDAYVEYTGTALTAILKHDPMKDPEAVRMLVRSDLAHDGIRVLDPIGFENTFAMMMRREQAERLGIRRLSDLSRHQSDIRPGAGPEFMNRPDGWRGLVAAYGLKFDARPREMDRNLLYEALARGTIDLAAGDSTDGRIAALDLVVLEDDRRFFPPYEAVPLVREDAIRRHPEIADALKRLSGKIDAATMRRLNYEIDGKKRRPEDVSREFLRGAKLIP